MGAVLPEMGPALDGVKTYKKGKYGGAPEVIASGLEMPAFTAQLDTPFPPVGTPVVFDKILYNGRQNSSNTTLN